MSTQPNHLGSINNNPTMTAAAIRMRRLRAERERQAQIAKLKATQFDKGDGPPLTLAGDIDGSVPPKGTANLTLDTDANLEKKSRTRGTPWKPPVTDGRRVGPKGAGPDEDQKYSSKELPPPKFATFAEGKALRDFLYARLVKLSTTSTEYVCILCQVVIIGVGAEVQEVEAAMVPHLEKLHPKVWQGFLDSLKEPPKKVCPINHEQKIEEHPKGNCANLPLQCGGCKKVLWTPPAPPKPAKPRPVKTLVKRKPRKAIPGPANMVPDWVTDDKPNPESNI
jgi:hypothetical protein